MREIEKMKFFEVFGGVFGKVEGSIGVYML